MKHIPWLVGGACLFLISVSSHHHSAHAQTPRKSKSKPAHSKSPLKTLVREEVERTVPSGLQVVSISVPHALAKKSSERDVVALEWRSAPKSGRTIVQIIVHKKSGRIEKGWGRVELARRKEVVIAAVPLRPGMIISLTDLRSEERLVRDEDQLAMDPRHLLGAKVLTAVSIGSPLTSDHIAMPPPVARGTIVRVVVKRGGVVATTTGALEAKTRVGSHAGVRVGGRILRGQLVNRDTLVPGDNE